MLGMGLLGILGGNADATERADFVKMELGYVGYLVKEEDWCAFVLVRVVGGPMGACVSESDM